MMMNDDDFINNNNIILYYIKKYYYIIFCVCLIFIISLVLIHMIGNCTNAHATQSIVINTTKPQSFLLQH